MNGINVSVKNSHLQTSTAASKPNVKYAVLKHTPKQNRLKPSNGTKQISTVCPRTVSPVIKCGVWNDVKHGPKVSSKRNTPGTMVQTAAFPSR